MPRLTQINGKPVVFATTSIEMEVTDEHVRKGRRKDWCHCAIAQCALDQPGVIHAAATLSRLYLEYKDKVVVCAMPSSARNQLIGFDRFSEIKFASGLYRFSPVSPSQRTGKTQGSGTNRHIKLKSKKRMLDLRGWVCYTMGTMRGGSDAKSQRKRSLWD